VISAGYIHAGFSRDYRTAVVDFFQLFCNEVSFDGIVVQGTSGLMFGNMLADAYDKKLIIVRKENDGSHAWQRIEGWENCTRLVFLDDFVSSGMTFGRVNNSMQARYGGMWEWVGAFLWCAANECHDRMSEMRGRPVYRMHADINHTTGKISTYTTLDPLRGQRTWEVKDAAQVGIRTADAVHAGECRV
jgi:hypothetical protein